MHGDARLARTMLVLCYLESSRAVHHLKDAGAWSSLLFLQLAKFKMPMVATFFNLDSRSDSTRHKV